MSLQRRASALCCAQNMFKLMHRDFRPGHWGVFHLAHFKVFDSPRLVSSPECHAQGCKETHSLHAAWPYKDVCTRTAGAEPGHCSPLLGEEIRPMFAAADALLECAELSRHLQREGARLRLFDQHRLARLAPSAWPSCSLARVRISPAAAASGTRSRPQGSRRARSRFTESALASNTSVIPGLSPRLIHAGIGCCGVTNSCYISGWLDKRSEKATLAVFIS
eukprot:6174651-Pleurochrysis_carterae.AAC.8